MNFPLITDPYFYLVAVPAVLLLGVSKSGFGTGFGALAVPLMAVAVTVPQAAAILMPVLLVMDLLGVRAGHLLPRTDLGRAAAPTAPAVGETLPLFDTSGEDTLLFEALPAGPGRHTA